MTTRILATALAVLIAGCLAVFASWPRASSERGPGESARGEQGTSEHRATVAEPLPAPSGDTVLRVSGVARGNVSPRVSELDIATLDELARDHVTVHEPFLKRDVRFSGVRMDEFLRRTGVAASAATLTLHALDDYHVVLPIADLAPEGFLATRADGKPIAIADGGPIRLVFTSDRGIAANTDNWIWSIDSMRAAR